MEVLSTCDLSFRSLNLLLLLLIFVIVSFSSSSSSLSHPHRILNSIDELRKHTAISDFRLINRRSLLNCPRPSPYIQINFTPNSSLADEVYVTVKVTGISQPSDADFVVLISPSHANIKDCALNKFSYVQTGDLADHPLLCHYPVKAQYLRNDPGYLSCKEKECKKYNYKGECSETTCSGSITFHVINFRTDIQFVLFANGFKVPCLLKRSSIASFANPAKPLYGHLASVDSTGTSMRLTWISGSNRPQQVQYGNGKSQTSTVSTFTQNDMCSPLGPSPAKDFGWHDPGFIHSAVMTGLSPSTFFSYRYGSDLVGWSNRTQFRTPPAGGSDELKFLAYGDMGKAPRDPSDEHFIQPGSLSVVKAMSDEVASGNVDAIFHIGDISYATGFLVEWDYFLNLISPIASRVTYMTAIGNHERDYALSGSVYETPDSGGECGVPYEAYFPMPTFAKDKPWYSIEQGSVHFTVISTEHDFKENSEQYLWMISDMSLINRSRTPWLVFAGHRPMYSSVKGLLSVDGLFVSAVEPLLLQNKVDLAIFGHVHNYERTCALYQGKCMSRPIKDRNGIDTYNNNHYTAPVHAIIGMAGFSLDLFPDKNTNEWSLAKITEFGYLRAHATRKDLTLELVNANTRKVEDAFRITR